MNDPLAGLVERLEQFPSIGGKTATRMAYWLLKQPDQWVADLATTIAEVKTATKSCTVCCGYSKELICDVCSDETRDPYTICVVATTEDMRAFVKNVPTFKASFHVLQGVINPTEGIGPERIRAVELLRRLTELVTDDKQLEVIVALDGSIEATATTLWLTKTIGSSAKVSRIAFGLAASTDITNADAQSLENAIQNRR